MQGGDIETQRQLLSKEKEIFQKDKDISALKVKLEKEKSKDPKRNQKEEFEQYISSGLLDNFIDQQNMILTESSFDPNSVSGSSSAKAFGLLQQKGGHVQLSEKGRAFFEWLLLNEHKKP